MWFIDFKHFIIALFMFWLSKERNCCRLNWATFRLRWAHLLCCLSKHFASKKSKKLLDDQWSERTHGKRKVAQLKRQLLLSVDSQSIREIILITWHTAIWVESDFRNDNREWAMTKSSTNVIKITWSKRCDPWAVLISQKETGIPFLPVKQSSFQPFSLQKDKNKSLDKKYSGTTKYYGKEYAIRCMYSL